MVILITIGIIGLALVIGISPFLFRRRPREDFREEYKKEVVTLTLRGLHDVDMICHKLSKGNVVILSVKDLARLDMIRLKRSIQQLKSFIRSCNGDIVALGKDFVVLVPPNMKLSLLKSVLHEANTNEDDAFDHPPPPPTEADTL